jgi:hypothetical protein
MALDADPTTETVMFTARTDTPEAVDTPTTVPAIVAPPVAAGDGAPAVLDGAAGELAW